MASYLISLTQLTVIILSLFFMIEPNPTKAQTIFNGTIFPNCSATCGDIIIPYPFGIETGCAFDESFVINCSNTSTPNKPYFSTNNTDLEILNITRCNVKVNIPPESDLRIGSTDNFVVALDWSLPGDCRERSAICSLNTYCLPENNTLGETTGFTCYCNQGYEGNPYLHDGCQDINECEDHRYEGCGVRGCENFNGTYRCGEINTRAKIAFIGTGSGFGLLLLLLGLWWSYKQIKRRRKMKLKRKFFEKNGGLLMEQELSTGKEGYVEKTKLFTSKELEKATDHYNKSRILGYGGQGTVYKGMLDDGRIVAVKKSKMVDEGNLQQFINEVVILSQINHRNIVKLYGCCLETEVPLLVYEYIPNGTLSHYIHHDSEDFPLYWDIRLRIATEAATALSYLHSNATVSIYHRDIKSTNILLDDKYRAKLADFGTSRSIAIDQTHLTTRVLGTFGYLDPEYFQSSQYTDKSDVYSFGVVLIELLTSQKPISLTTSGEGQSLATNFITVMEENRLFDMLDAHVIKEGSKDEINGVANLARRCLNLNGRKRPTMNEVARELESIRMSNGACNYKIDQQDYEEVEIAIGEVGSPWEMGETATRFF